MYPKGRLKKNLLLSIVFILVGIVATGVGTFLAYNELSFYITARAKTEGVVTNRWSQGLESSGDSDYQIFRIEIQFINEKTGGQVTVYSNKETYKIGSKVPILYNPDNPTIFRIDRSSYEVWSYQFGAVFALFIGVFCLIWGIQSARVGYLDR